MIVPRTSRLAILVALALVPAAASAGTGTPPRIAVAPASTGAAGPSAASARAAAEAVRQAGADVVLPDVVARASFAARSAGRCTSDATCAVAVCTAVGADHLLEASVTDAAGSWRVEVRLRDGKRGSVRAQGAESVARDDALARQSAARLAQRLVATVLAPDGELPPPVVAAPAAPPAPAAAPAARPASALALELPGRSTPEPGLSRRHLTGDVLLGTGAALLAGAAVSGAYAWSAETDARAALARGDVGRFATSRRSSRTLAWTGATLAGTGGVALAAGAWLRLGGSSRVAIAPEPGVAGARVAIAF